MVAASKFTTCTSVVAADKNILSKRTLEVGAASGYNLSLYTGKRRFGIEPSALNCKLAKKNYGVEMFNGLWSEFLEKIRARLSI